VQPWALLDAIWTGLLGELGQELDFVQLERRRSANDALASPPGFCRLVKADLESPVFQVPAERLREIVSRVAQDEPRTVLIAPSSCAGETRYLVRSPILRFPDLVDVRVIARGEHASTLAIYSRSRVGRYDFGVNRRRVERWLRRVAASAG